VNNRKESFKIFMIDGDNKPCFQKEFCENGLYLCFVAEINSALCKYNNWTKLEGLKIDSYIDENKLYDSIFKLLVVAEGALNDISDHYMTLYIHSVIEIIQRKLQNKDVEVIIVSSDHSSWCTKACFDKSLLWRDIQNVKVTNKVSI
jgi:hypothetical protein